MKKSFIMALALVLVLGIAIGGTVAWLTDKTATVTNTFTTSDIEISLTETKQSDGTNLGTEAWTAQLVPGATYTKDPVVKVEDDTDVDIYLFVEFEEKNNSYNNLFNYLVYGTTFGQDYWIQGTGEVSDENPNGNGVPTDVWYRIVKKDDSTKSWSLLILDQVTINSSLTKDSMPASDKTPSLTFTAYACQLYKNSTETFTPAEAWEKVGN